MHLIYFKCVVIFVVGGQKELDFHSALFISTLLTEPTFVYNSHKLNESGDHHGKSKLGNT